MLASDFDYALPPERIAQAPLEHRDEARLYVLAPGADAATATHRQVRDLPSLLPPGALVVVNDTRVIPARLHATKPTGGRVELLLVEPLDGAPAGQARWRCLGGASKPIRLGPLALDGAQGVTPPAASVVAVEGEYVTVDFAVEPGPGAGGLDAYLQAAGEMPLPPYIKRPAPDPADRERYQTLFAAAPGAVAAPTAGLHFTPALVDALGARGIAIARLTLHVGPGTFAPLRQEQVDQARLHPERYVVPEATAQAIAGARAAGRPVVAVGTTVVRTLESAARPDGSVAAGAGRTELFIRPGFRFRVTDLLVTNFHLPKSSLLMLVCAFGGKERVLAAYNDAVAHGYRFFSYGDAMLVHPGGTNVP